MNKQMCMLIELTNGKRHWYRVGRKMFNAIQQDRALKRSLNQPVKPLYQYLHNYYINVPLTPYFKHTSAIGVGQIKKIAYRNMPKKTLCVRSQFVTPDALNESIFHCYHYLRHDYGKYSHLNQFIDLYLWKQKQKPR